MGWFSRKKKVLPEVPPFDAERHYVALVEYVGRVYLPKDPFRDEEETVLYSLRDDHGRCDAFDAETTKEVLDRIRSGMGVSGASAEVLKKTASQQRTLPRDKTFVEQLQQLIRERGLRDVRVYTAAGIDRRLFSRMMSDADYKPSKDTAVALALALRLDFDAAADLLKRAGFSFSHSVRRDIALEYCFREGIYLSDNVNELLFKMGEKTLGR